MKLVHIINPVKVNLGSDLYIAQPITFESFKIAKSHSEALQIIQCTAQYIEDTSIIPEFYTRTKNLKRSVANFGGPELSRKLPLIKDILKRSYKLSRRGDYIIYSNVDIALKPKFYEWVNTQIINGHDAFVINRRTISSKYTKSLELPLMFEEKGEEHPGYDCFVFKRDIFKKFILGNICVGAVYIGIALFLNMKLFAKNFKEFGDEQLTFHIGNDQVWRSPDNNPYTNHNKAEFEKIKNKLNKKFNTVDEALESAFPSVKINNKI
jgi:hypothetical protein